MPELCQRRQLLKPAIASPISFTPMIKSRTAHEGEARRPSMVIGSTASSALAEHSFDRGRHRVGKASHSESVEEAEETREDRDEEGDLERAVARPLVDAQHLCLHVLGLPGEQGLEL